VNLATRELGNLQTLQLANSWARELVNLGTRELGNMQTLQLANSWARELVNLATRELGNSQTLQIANSWARELVNLGTRELFNWWFCLPGFAWIPSCKSTQIIAILLVTVLIVPDMTFPAHYLVECLGFEWIPWCISAQILAILQVTVPSLPDMTCPAQYLIRMPRIICMDSIMQIHSNCRHPTSLCSKCARYDFPSTVVSRVTEICIDYIMEIS
jgi:hypothetical protein